MAELTVYRLGRVEYGDGLELQRRFAEARRAGHVGDVLLLLEHSPVLTLGRGAKVGNIVAPTQHLNALGVDVFETSRGGDVTYHGPGQIVGYPIFLLGEDRQDVRRYVRDIEEIQIRTVAAYGLQAARIPKWPGVWLGEEGSIAARKIAAIGVHISRWLTTHGFALNVNTDLTHFELIVPCGIREAGVTSIQKELGRAIPLAEVEALLARNFGDVFGAELRFAEPDLRTVAVAMWTRSEHGPKVLLLKRRAERGGFWQIVTGRIEPDESPEAAARRELEEETGQGRPVKDLDYRHSFAWGETERPLVVEEHGFGAFVDAELAPRLSAEEHEEYRWVPVDEALKLLPFEGLRRTVRRAVTE